MNNQCKIKHFLILLSIVLFLSLVSVGVYAVDCASDHCIDLSLDWGVKPNNPPGSRGCEVFGGIDAGKTCPSGKICCKATTPECLRKYGSQGYKCVPTGTCTGSTQSGVCPGKTTCCKGAAAPAPTGGYSCPSDRCIDTKLGWGADNCGVFGGKDAGKTCPSGKICCLKSTSECVRKYGSQKYKCLATNRCIGDTKSGVCPGALTCCNKEGDPSEILPGRQLKQAPAPPRFFFDARNVNIPSQTTFDPKLDVSLFNSIEDPQKLNEKLKKIYEATGIRIVFVIAKGSQSWTTGSGPVPDWKLINVLVSQKFDLFYVVNPSGSWIKHFVTKRYDALGKWKGPVAKDMKRDPYGTFFKYVKKGKYLPSYSCHYCRDARNIVKKLYGDAAYNKCKGNGKFACCKAPCPPGTVFYTDPNKIPYYNQGYWENAKFGLYDPSGAFKKPYDCTDKAKCCSFNGVNGKSYGSSACGPTSLKMLLESVGKNIHEKDLFCQWSKDKVYSPAGSGGGRPNLMIALWKAKTGLDAETVCNRQAACKPSGADVVKNIKQGYGYILSMSEHGKSWKGKSMKSHVPSDVTQRCEPVGGHFITLIGASSDGKYMIFNDPWTVRRGEGLDFGVKGVDTKTKCIVPDGEHQVYDYAFFKIVMNHIHKFKTR